MAVETVSEEYNELNTMQVDKIEKIVTAYLSSHLCHFLITTIR